MRTTWIATLTCTLIACGESEAPGSRVLGSPDDVTTTAGLYEGYEVIDGCANDEVVASVVGTGASAYSTPADFDPTFAVNPFHDLAWEVSLQMFERDLPWTSSGGPGRGCAEGATAATITVYDWRVVDELIDLTGAFLAERDLNSEVALSVAPFPSADGGKKRLIPGP